MKRRKSRFPMPAKPGPVSDLVLTFVPRPDDPDPSSMIDVYPGPPPLEFSCLPRPDDPDPATMIDIRPARPNISQPAAEQNGHAPASDPSGDGR